MDLAACKVELDEQFTPNCRSFKNQVLREYEEWLIIVKDRAFRAGIPLALHHKRGTIDIR